MVKDTWVAHFVPFWTLLDHFGMLTSLPCLVSFGHPHAWTVDPKVKKGSSPGLPCAFRTPKRPFWNINMAESMKNVKNRSKFNEKWPLFAIILPWMASYGSKISFLLIFSDTDDLVKVSWKSNSWKCQNQVTLLWPGEWKVPAHLECKYIIINVERESKILPHRNLMTIIFLTEGKQ